MTSLSRILKKEWKSWVSRNDSSPSLKQWAAWMVEYQDDIAPMAEEWLKRKRN